MFKRILPFVFVAIALSVVFSVLFATRRMGSTRPAFGRFMKRATDLPVEPVEADKPVEPDTTA
jgi:hypothetical protein